jgi:hypothetical protein
MQNTQQEKTQKPFENAAKMPPPQPQGSPRAQSETGYRPMGTREQLMDPRNYPIPG